MVGKPGVGSGAPVSVGAVASVGGTPVGVAVSVGGRVAAGSVEAAVGASVGVAVGWSSGVAAWQAANRINPSTARIRKRVKIDFI
jgi:hypothetical protein